ncbi:MAG TPA: hypothetical protein VHB25_05580 [Gemmatimonadaceae bacterium]|nr:hypothetical protein [Gemmatimonadaceae bacterium]
MSDDRPWYREPETFVAVAALIVSISAVVVGIYEAALQRRHDRAEVWPHLEIGTYTSPKDAKLSLQNNGIGPAIVQSIVVTVDGKPRRNWDSVLVAVAGVANKNQETSAAGRGIRAGDAVELLGVLRAALPPTFLDQVGRIAVHVCYTDVFGDAWTVTDTLGKRDVWRNVDRCPPQPSDAEF